MTPLAYYKTARRTAFRKYRKLYAEWEAALKAHSEWLHACPARWEALCHNTLAGDELAKHKEMGAKERAASRASALAAMEWKRLNEAVAEFQESK